ncbi:S53 family peptidase [Actinomadura sp. NPDC023710]|uniref:S53 family peptidase n=1 Tax=Actinomadura sp. NPDC023710 TaxID=3158219 RepID=UPI0033F4395F
MTPQSTSGRLVAGLAAAALLAAGAAIAIGTAAPAHGGPARSTLVGGTLASGAPPAILSRGVISTLDIAPAPTAPRDRGGARTMRGTATPPAGPVVPVPPSQCPRLYNTTGCYGPPQINHAYGLDRLHRRGLTGKGRTIAIPICFHNPHLRKNVATYSRHWGLPPANLEVMQYGKVPTADPGDPGQAACAAEAAVDVQSVHAIAPAAKIIVVETGTDQTGGTVGLDELIGAIGWVTRHRKVDAVTASWGAFEANFPEQSGREGDYRLLTRLRGPLKAAHRRGTTLIASSGNRGPTGPNLAGTAFYTHPSVAWPASDPLVTAVGGTRVHLTDTGVRTAPDQVWDDEGGVATGAGPSAVFGRPAYQARLTSVVGERRGSVDVALNGSGKAREWFFSSYNPIAGQQPGWIRVAGTSIAAPKLAGIVALAAQKAGRPVGDIHRVLYSAPGSARLGLTDLTTGTNTANGVTGFQARRGYDLPSGVGTVRDAGRLVNALAH